MTRAQDAMRKLFGVKHGRAGNLPSLPGIFPDQLALIKADPRLDDAGNAGDAGRVRRLALSRAGRGIEAAAAVAHGSAYNRSEGERMDAGELSG